VAEATEHAAALERHAREAMSLRQAEAEARSDRAERDRVDLELACRAAAAAAENGRLLCDAAIGGERAASAADPLRGTATALATAARELRTAADQASDGDLDRREFERRLDALRAATADASDALGQLLDTLRVDLDRAQGASAELERERERVARLEREATDAAARVAEADERVASAQAAGRDAQEAIQAANARAERAEREVTAAGGRARSAEQAATAASSDAKARSDQAVELADQLARERESGAAARAGAARDAAQWRERLTAAETLLHGLADLGIPPGGAATAAAALSEIPIGGGLDETAAAVRSLVKALVEDLAQARRQAAIAESASAAAATDLAAATRRADATAAELSSARIELAAAAAQAKVVLDDRAAAQDELASRARELAETRSAVALREAEARAAREDVAERERELERLRGVEATLRQAQEQAALAARGAEAWKEAQALLLGTIKRLGHTGNEASDRVGVGLPSASRSFTRTTARLDRAAGENEPMVAAENARAIVERVEIQLNDLAQAVTAVRRERIAATEAAEAAASDARTERERGATLSARVAQLEPLVDEVRKTGAERSALAARAEELESRLATDLAALEAERRADRAGLSEAEARLAELERALEEAREQGRIAALASGEERERLARRIEVLADEADTARAGAAEQAAALNAGLDERDRMVTSLRTELDRARADRAEVAGLEARIRTLNRKLAEATAECGRLQVALGDVAEREVQAVALNAAAADLTAERDALAKAAKRLESELRDERARASSLERALSRLERQWRARLAEAEEARKRAEEQRSTASNVATRSHRRSKPAPTDPHQS
jgi:chromosome segregation ATPase